MQHCARCGTENWDGTAICVKCKNSLSTPQVLIEPAPVIPSAPGGIAAQQSVLKMTQFNELLPWNSVLPLSFKIMLILLPSMVAFVILSILITKFYLGLELEKFMREWEKEFGKSPFKR